MNKGLFSILTAIIFVTAAGCANITSPTGGKKDTVPPKRLTISPSDSLKNTRVKKVELSFDEFITLTDAAKEVQISPLLAIQPTVSSINKKVVVKIADSLLEENTTYRISFGSAIRDLHEGNPYPAYTYVFSTGSYFDSLQLSGKVINAATGLSDTTGIVVMLYNATENDSAVVRHKPRYVTRTDGSGQFRFNGLPSRNFRIYAVKDVNDNLTYDGEAEMIGFIDKTVVPGDTNIKEIVLKVFTEIDTAAKNTDTVKSNIRVGTKEPAKVEGFSYSVNVDTSTKVKRTFDINNHLAINFTRTATINNDKITLLSDTGEMATTEHYTIVKDTLHQHTLTIATDWKENTLYTLKLAKGFAKDSSGADAMPSKYIFRTKEDEDYGKLSIHLPSKYSNKAFVLQVTADNDTVYQQRISDSVVNLNRLKPAKYNFRVIDDRNNNGKWDAGSLFRKVQPEDVIPYPGGLMLKAGWENIVDFEPKAEPKAKTGTRR